MINKVMLIGNLGRDPEIRDLDGGKKVGRFSIATNENYQDNTGNWQTKTYWHDIVVWNRLAERAETQLKKGMLVFVEGKITNRKYTDKDNIERYITEINAMTFRLLEKRESSEQLGQRGTDDYKKPDTTSLNNVNDEPTSAPTEEEDDLPF